MAGGGGAPADDGGSKGNVFGESLPQQVDLNLTALMDILSNLLFFLLASFGATLVMSINATVPVQSASDSDIADNKQQVTVNINLGKNQVDMSAAGSAQTEQELAALKKTFANINGAPDFPSITAQLIAIKKAFPKSDTILLTPEPGIPYSQMIGVMDAARETRDPESKQPAKLFPTVVVSTVLR